MSQKSVVKLETASLSGIAERMRVPGYDRNALKPWILHIGVGGFHRAHMAYYTDELLQTHDSAWAINGVGLTERDRTMADTMDTQDGLYSLLVRSADREEPRIIGAITKYYHYPDGAGELCRIAADGEYRILSLTVTESGYHYTGDDRHLDMDDPAIQHDLQNPDDPTTSIGFLFRVAQLRIQAGRTLPTFLSCDNIPHNGSVLRSLVLQYADQVDPQIARVLAEQGRFPSSMVDRITPGTEDKDRAYVREELGIEDRWPVVCEDFIQWFVEDNFSDGRPEWDKVGAVLVPDVTPYERMKIRLLNGAHSALAYISYLLGFRNVDNAMADPAVNKFVSAYMKEIEPTVGDVPGVNLDEYEKKLVERFSNPAISDQILRLCEDGSRKIPNMMLEPTKELMISGQTYRHAAFAVAAWIRFLQGSDEAGIPIPIKDPSADILQEVAQRCADEASQFLAVETVFPEPLRNSAAFTAEVNMWFHKISDEGSRAAIDALLETKKRQ
jgi:mannitol 2-dehydrogenase